SVTEFNSTFGIQLARANSRIEGCWFGVRPDGTEAFSSFPIIFQAVDSIFGGDSPAQRNVWVNQRQVGIAGGRASNNLFGLLPDGRSPATVSVFTDLIGNGFATAL